MADLMLRNESDRTRLLGYIQGLDLAKPRRLTIVEVRSKRSDAQNRLLWQWNGLIQAHLRDSFGQLASSEEWHEILWPSSGPPRCTRWSCLMAPGTASAGPRPASSTPSR